MRIRITETDGREVDLDTDLGTCYLRNSNGADCTVEQEGGQETWTPFNGCNELLACCGMLLEKLKFSK
jgi:hypothetical protein